MALMNTSGVLLPTTHRQILDAEVWWKGKGAIHLKTIQFWEEWKASVTEPILSRKLREKAHHPRPDLSKAVHRIPSPI